MKNIKFSYSDTNTLHELIEEVYFADNNVGRKSDTVKKYIILEKGNFYYDVLSGIDYQIKIKNDIIDGTMLFDKIEDEDKIRLVPSSMFCMKEKNKYSFY